MKKTVDRDSPKILSYEEFSDKLRKDGITEEIINDVKLERAQEEEKQKRTKKKVVGMEFIPAAYDRNCSLDELLNVDIRVISTEKYIDKMKNGLLSREENPINAKPPKYYTIAPKRSAFMPNPFETTTVVSDGGKEDSSYRGLCIRLLTSLKEEVGVIEVDGGEPLNTTKKVIKEAEQKLC